MLVQTGGEEEECEEHSPGHAGFDCSIDRWRDRNRKFAFGVRMQRRGCHHHADVTLGHHWTCVKVQIN